jgi:hypothetical protein
MVSAVMKCPSVKAVIIVGSVIVGGGTVHSCYRQHISSYPVNERVDIVLSNGGKSYRSYVNVSTSFSTGFPDSGGSIVAIDWPVQFTLPDGRILYATIEDLLIAPDNLIERHQSVRNGVERRNIAIQKYLGKRIPLCVEWSKYLNDAAYCPTFFVFKKKGDLNSIEIIRRGDIKKLFGKGWGVTSVSITLNRQVPSMPAVTEFSTLSKDPERVARIISGRVSHKQLCQSWPRGKNPFCKELEN